jgi:hypothetical protein
MEVLISMLFSLLHLHNSLALLLQHEFSIRIRFLLLFGFFFVVLYLFSYLILHTLVSGCQGLFFIFDNWIPFHFSIVLPLLHNCWISKMCKRHLTWLTTICLFLMECIQRWLRLLLKFTLAYWNVSFMRLRIASVWRNHVNIRVYVVSICCT